MTLEFTDGFNIQPTTGGGGTTINNQDKTITSNGEYTADTGYTGLGTVTVDVPNPSTGTLSVTENGTYNVTNYASADVNVEPTLTTKSITQNGTYNASSDSADGYSSVTVNVPNPSTGTLNITSNSTYDVTNYASAVVNVAGGASSKYGCTLDTMLGNIDANGVLQTPQTETDVIFTGVQDLADYALYEKFARGRAVKNLSFPDLVAINGNAAMGSICFNSYVARNIDLSHVFTIKGNAALKSAFSSYTTTTINLSNLEQIGKETVSSANETNGSHFESTFGNNFDTLTLEKLKEIYCTGGSYNGTFCNNMFIKKFYLPMVDTITYATGAGSSNQEACKNIFKNCNQLIELHFGAANQTAIEASAGYSTLWGRGAGQATVYFDL